jgi:uncharacterized phage protein (TIGR02220 family)
VKNTIAGFNQEYALTLKKTVPAKGDTEKTIKIDCTDLVILRWLVDFYPSMKKMTVDGREYVWLTHKKLQEDIPLLDISKRACVERMQKLVEFKILDYKFLKQGGTFSLYAFGENYINLVRSTEYPVCSQPDTGCAIEQLPGVGSTIHPVDGQPDNKDISIIDSPFIDKVKYIVEHLNEKAAKRYKPTSKDTQTLIRARMNDGFKTEDFITVIDKMCAKWKGDAKMDDYLRPSTLFGTKFESYLNTSVPQPAVVRGGRQAAPTVGPNGIPINPSKNDLDKFLHPKQEATA